MDATATDDDESKERIVDSDIYHAETVDARASEFAETGAVELDVAAHQVTPQPLKIVAWGNKQSLMLQATADTGAGTISPAIHVDADDARELGRRLIATADWLEEFDAEKE
jgi:hypothetical protein